MRHLSLVFAFHFSLSLLCSDLLAQPYKPLGRWLVEVEAGALFDRVREFNDLGQPTNSNAWSTTPSFGWGISYRLAKHWSLFSEVDLYRRQLPLQENYESASLEFSSNFVADVAFPPNLVAGKRDIYQIATGGKLHLPLTRQKVVNANDGIPEFHLGLGVVLLGNIQEDLTYYDFSDPNTAINRVQNRGNLFQAQLLGSMGVSIPLSRQWLALAEMCIQWGRKRWANDVYYYPSLGLAYRL
ncbi:MAG: hypothetical protein AAFR61_07905 [Bacteroidota bacterium]